MISEEELRLNHEFVISFESLHKRHGFREMDDAALISIADVTGAAYGTLRLARHLRNALAHGETVNRSTLQRLHAELDDITRAHPATAPTRRISSAGDDVRAYRIHAWQDPRLEQQMLVDGFVSVGGEEIGDLSGITDPEVIRDQLSRTMPDSGSRAIALFVGYWRRFLWDATPGDLVVLPTRSREVAIGEFVGPYHYVAAGDPRARHRRPASWNAVNVPRDAFGQDLVITLNGHHTVQEFKAIGATNRLRVLADSGIDPGPSASIV